MRWFLRLVGNILLATFLMLVIAALLIALATVIFYLLWAATR